MGDLRQPATMFTELDIASEDGSWLPVDVVIITGQPDETRELFSREFGIDPTTLKIGSDGRPFAFCSIIVKLELWELLFLEGARDGVRWMVIDGDDRHLGVIPNYRPADAYHIPLWVPQPTVKEAFPEPLKLPKAKDEWVLKYSGKVHPGQVIFKTKDGDFGTTPTIGDRGAWPVGIVTNVDEKSGVVTITSKGYGRIEIGKVYPLSSDISDTFKRFKKREADHEEES